MNFSQPCRKKSQTIRSFLFPFQPNISHYFFREKENYFLQFSSGHVERFFDNPIKDPLPWFSNFFRSTSEAFFIKSVLNQNTLVSSLDNQTVYMTALKNFSAKVVKFFCSFSKKHKSLYFFLSKTHKSFLWTFRKQFPQPYQHSCDQKLWQLSLQFQKQLYEKIFFPKRKPSFPETFSR